MSEMNEIMRENDNFCQHHRKFDVGVTTGGLQQIGGSVGG
jgi:hypothetical protein